MATQQKNEIIFQIIFDDTGVKRKIGDAEVSVKKFDRELKKATQTTKEFNTELSGRDKLVGNTGLAGAALTELGRTISDMPYGIRGVANNLSQLSTLFVTLVAKVDDSVKGFNKVKVAGKMLIDEALRGPLGIILAFQVVISLLDAFAGKAKKAEEAADDLADAMKRREGLRESVFVFAEMLKDANSSIEEQQFALAKLQKEGFDETKGSLEDFIAAYKIKQDLDAEDEKRQKNIEELTGKRTEQLELIATKEAEVAAKRKEIDSEEDERRLRTLLFQEKGLKEEIENAKISLQTTEASISAINAAFKNGIEDITNDPTIKDNPFYASLIGLKVKEIEEESPAEIIIKGTVKAIESQIKVLEKLRDETATTGKEYDSFTLRIKELQDELNELQGVQEREEVESVNAFKKREEEKETTLKEAFLKRLRQRNFEDDLAEENHQKDLKRIEDRIAAQEKLASFITQQAGQFAQIQSQAFDAQVSRLDAERDIILNNDNITAQEKDRLLKQNDKESRRIRIQQIKFERDMFQLEAGLELAKLALQGKTLLAGVIGTGAKQTAEATGSIGKFLTELGPIAGPIAYAAMIGGVIAQIATARKKAEQQIKALSGPLAGVSSGGGGSAPIAPPAFNVVGATQTSQLAQTISQAEQQPLRAYVVASDISTAQELERSTIEGASIG